VHRHELAPFANRVSDLGGDNSGSGRFSRSTYRVGRSSSTERAQRRFHGARRYDRDRVCAHSNVRNGTSDVRGPRERVSEQRAGRSIAREKHDGNAHARTRVRHRPYVMYPVRASE